MLICYLPRKRWRAALAGRGGVAGLSGRRRGGGWVPDCLGFSSPAASSSSSPSSPLWAEEVVSAAGEIGGGGWRKEAAAREVWSQADRCYWSSAAS